MNWTRLIVAVALCLCVVQANRVVLERSYNSAYVPDGFQVVGEPNPETTIDLHFAIKQQNKDMLQDYLKQVSDPRLPTYGHYLTWEQVGNLIAPSPVSIRLLRNWLEHHGVSFHFAGTGDWIVAETTVAQAEQMLQTTFSLITTTTNKNVIRALQPYSVPAEIAPHLDFIGGVHGFVGLVAQTITTKNSRANPDINPAVVKEYTNSTGVVGLASNNSQAVAQFLEQYYTPSDLTMFQQEFDLPQNAVTKVDGPNDPSQPGVEASLDIEYIMAAGEDIATWFVSTAGRHQGQEPFLTWIEDMEAEPDAPWVHSVSYGDKETTISADYADRCETEFQKFGTTGRTIFFASGDDGVGCKTTSCSGGQTPTLVPNWPASSPSVTAVGGIVLLSDGALEGDKISSGGFSNLFATPSYQTTVVSNYLNTATLPAVSFNTSGRGIPDVSAFSENVQIVVEGRNTKVGGTSCASPITAGIFALLNDLRIQNNLPTLGFLNPWLYYVAQTYSDAFTDVIGGQNTHSCCTGFTAVAGWDPITGWGLANYATLSNYVLTVTSY